MKKTFALIALLALFLINSISVIAQQNAVLVPLKPFPDPDKWYFIELGRSGMVIEIPDVNTAQNKNLRNNERIRLMLSTKTSSGYQQWRFLESDNFKGFYRIINKASNLVMEVPYSSMDPGSYIQQYKMLSQSTRAQFYKLIHLCNSELLITPLLNGLVFTAGNETHTAVFNPASNSLGISELKFVDGWFVRQFRLGSSELQKWTLIEAE